MTTDELLAALTPYGIDLYFSTTTNRWHLCLNDWQFWHCDSENAHDALQTAWEAVQG